MGIVNLTDFSDQEFASVNMNFFHKSMSWKGNWTFEGMVLRPIKDGETINGAKVLRN